MTWASPKLCPLWRGISLLAALLGGLIAACGPTPPATSPPPAGPTPTVTVPFELPIVIAIVGHFADAELATLDQQIATFEAANPDIRVEVVWAPRTAPERHAEFAARLGEGDASRDIYLLNTPWLTEFVANDWLLPLDEYVKSGGIETTDFLPPTIQASAVAGRLMALPWTADGGLLYYRRDLLDKYGYEPPTTWAALQRIALELKAREGLPYGYVWQGAAYESLTCNTLEFIWANGGEALDDAGHIAFDSPATRAALQQMADLITLGASPPEVATWQEAAALDAFQRGDAILMRNWSYAGARLEAADSPLAGKVGVAPLPASCLGGRALALSAYSQRPHEAFRFMAFLVGYDQQRQIAQLRIQPPALETVYGDADSLAAALSAARPRPQTATYRALSEAIYTEVNRMLLGEQDAATTAATIQRRLEH